MYRVNIQNIDCYRVDLAVAYISKRVIQCELEYDVLLQKPNVTEDELIEATHQLVSRHQTLRYYESLLPSCSLAFLKLLSQSNDLGL